MIGVKLHEQDYQKLLANKGDKTVSEYVRELIIHNHREVKNEVEDFGKLLSDVSLIKERLTSGVSQANSQLNVMMALVVSIIESMAGARSNLEKKDPDLYAKLKL